MNKNWTPIFVMIGERQIGKWAVHHFGGVPAVGDILDVGDGPASETAGLEVLSRTWTPGPNISDVCDFEFGRKIVLSCCWRPS